MALALQLRARLLQLDGRVQLLALEALPVVVHRASEAAARLSEPVEHAVEPARLKVLQRQPEAVPRLAAGVPLVVQLAKGLPGFDGLLEEGLNLRVVGVPVALHAGPPRRCVAPHHEDDLAAREEQVGQKPHLVTGASDKRALRGVAQAPLHKGLEWNGHAAPAYLLEAADRLGWSTWRDAPKPLLHVAEQIPGVNRVALPCADGGVVLNGCGEPLLERHPELVAILSGEPEGRVCLQHAQERGGARAPTRCDDEEGAGAAKIALRRPWLLLQPRGHPWVGQLEAALSQPSVDLLAVSSRAATRAIRVLAAGLWRAVCAGRRRPTATARREALVRLRDPLLSRRLARGGADDGQLLKGRVGRLIVVQRLPEEMVPESSEAPSTVDGGMLRGEGNTQRVSPERQRSVPHPPLVGPEGASQRVAPATLAVEGSGVGKEALQGMTRAFWLRALRCHEPERVLVWIWRPRASRHLGPVAGRVMPHCQEATVDAVHVEEGGRRGRLEGVVPPLTSLEGLCCAQAAPGAVGRRAAVAMQEEHPRRQAGVVVDNELQVGRGLVAGIGRHRVLGKEARAMVVDQRRHRELLSPPHVLLPMRHDRDKSRQRAASERGEGLALGAHRHQLRGVAEQPSR